MSRSLIIPIIVTACLGALTSACGAKQVPQDELDKEPPLTPSPSYSLDGMPAGVRFEQGIYHEVDVMKYARVERGNPILNVRNLPEGATFDGRILGWKPPCGSFPDFYVHKIGMHVIMFSLKSDNDPDDFIERDMTLIVNEYDTYGGTRPCEEIEQ